MHVIFEAGFDFSQLRAFYAFVRMQAVAMRGSRAGERIAEREEERRRTGVTMKTEGKRGRGRVVGRRVRPRRGIRGE